MTVVASPRERCYRCMRPTGHCICDTLPTVLVDGYVAGVWRAVDGAVEVTAFEELSADAWDGIEDEAVRLQKLIADRDPNVYGRYGHWWDKAQLKPSRTFE